MKVKQIQTIYIMSIVFVLSFVLSACGGAAAPSASVEGETSQDDKMETMAGMGDEIPADLDVATERLTDQGLYLTRITSNLEPLDINQLHSWTLHLETPAGQAVENAEIVVGGGMPQHNHGFPTSPQVTENLGGGDYLVEGMRFNMTGWWEMKFDITANGQSDQITFNLIVETGHESEAMADADHGDHQDHSDKMAGGELMIHDIVGNLTLPSPTGAIYLTISNGTDQDEVLLGAKLEGCEVIEFHETKVTDDVMKMQPVAGGQITIPAGETVKLAQGGLHMMCIGRSQAFAAGDQVPVTLSFANAGEIERIAEVREPGQMSMDHGDHEAHGDHDDAESHGHEAHEHNKVPNDRAVINVVSPANGAEINAGEMIMVKVETEGFDLAAEGNHWHLYVDGELVEMIGDGRNETIIHHLESGEHTIMTTMANAGHMEFEVGAMIRVTVKE